MAYDQEVRDALEDHLPLREDVTSRAMFGGVGYMVRGKMFAALTEGAVAAKLPEELRTRALALAGVSPFRPGGRPFGEWVQFVVLLADDVPAVVPWLEAAYEYVGPLPARARRTRGA